MTAVVTATNLARVALTSGWELAAVPPESLAQAPSSLERDLNALPWEPACVPGTVASARRAANTWSLERTGEDFDESDFWYRCRFQSHEIEAGQSCWLRFDGLATLADAWLNGQHVLASDNMFVQSRVDVSALLRTHNELVIRFGSVAAATSLKRPRPRFRTRLVDRQQLRWIRTTLLGRMPGWSPPAAPVGPWRDVVLERYQHFSIAECRLRAALDGEHGLVSLSLTLSDCARPVTAASLRVGDRHVPLAVSGQQVCVLQGQLLLEQPELWWPHTYGDQPLYAVAVDVTMGEGTQTLELEPVAFRRLSVDTSGGSFAISVNGVEVRPFGACWTPADTVSLHDPDAGVAAVRQARAAGMSMLRVGGTMVYECDQFYAECDRCGIMVWQDFMFANCDYPSDDPKFAASVREEATQLLERLACRACLSVLCGGSEVYQQISMLGLARESWLPPLFESELRALCGELLPGVPYVPSTPSGGALPFQANAGVTHYYGVGAYLRPLEDARRAEVRFAAECLAFANVPEQSTLDALLGDTRAPFHEPRWKQRVPRDNGAGWDFDDVRDHYVRALFDVDPMLLRYQNPDRALALARVASGEVMSRTLSEWRREASTCRGALIWLFRDLWPGAGWGLVDALGRPKAAYYYVKRALQAQSIFASDEGVNGLCLEVVNTPPRPLSATVELTLWRAGGVKVAEGTSSFLVAPHGSAQIEAATLFEHFIDLTHAYRFGPPAYEVAVARLLDTQTNQLISEAFYFPTGLALPRVEDLGLQASLHRLDERYRVHLVTKHFAQSVAVEVPGYVADDSYFHMAPATEKWITLSPENERARPPRGVVRPLNTLGSVRVVSA